MSGYNWSTSDWRYMMTITISRELEGRLKSAALRKGVGASELASLLLESALESEQSTQRTIDVLEQWERDNATNDPDEIARRVQEFEQFSHAMNQNRIDSDGPDARTPYK